MITGLKTLIALSFLCGLSLWLCPEGSAKRVTRVLCSAILITALVTPLNGFDFDALSLAEAKMNSAQAEIINSSVKNGELLRKLMMQKNCENYIEEKGSAFGLRELHVTVTLERGDSGSWLPYKVRIVSSGTQEAAEQLRMLVIENLGIPAERQDWTLYES